MFFLPLSLLFIHETPSGHVVPLKPHQPFFPGWASLFIWSLFLVLGVFLLVRPYQTLRFFQPHLIHNHSFVPVRVIGGLMILGALFVFTRLIFQIL